MINIWEVDINKNYWLDNDYNIWKYEDDFYDYHFEDYHGTKDNYEEYQEELREEYGLVECTGKEVIYKIFHDLKNECYNEEKEDM